MKSIEPVHTLRISVQPRELTIGQIEELCAIPYRYAQRTITRFLSLACEQIPRAAGKLQVTDPLMWSVNERMNVVIFYLAAVLEDGPDFALGEGKLHDYLLSGSDYVDEVPMDYELFGEPMVCTPLHGYQAEAIEMLVETGSLPKNYASWQFGVVAACVWGVAGDRLEYVDPVSYRNALLARIKVIKDVAGSDFQTLYEAYSQASLKLQHFVHAVFNKEGVLAAQITDPDDETGVPVLGPARFHPRTGISRWACELFETDDEHESGLGPVFRSGLNDRQAPNA